MKTLKHIGIAVFICLAFSCGKSSNPTPPTPPITPPTTGGGTTGGGTTGGGTNSGGTGTTPDNTPIYTVALASSNRTTLDRNHDKILVVNFVVIMDNAIKLLPGGNVSFRAKNFKQADIAYENSEANDVERLFPTNIKLKNEPYSIADTTSKACFFITDPSLKDAATGKQIVKVLFLYNDLTISAGAIIIASISPFKEKEITAEQFIAKSNRNDLMIVK